MMLKSVERLLEFVGDMNATEINDHIKARPDGFAVSFRIDNEWLDGWNRAVLATVEKIEREVSERYMALPVDADGVPIRVGDTVTEHEDGHTFKVDGIKWWIDGWWVFQDQGIQAPANRCTHYHEPTVEDVLREFAIKWGDACDEDAYVAEYAKRLRLAGDDHDRD